MADLLPYLKDFDPYAPEWITNLQEAAEVYAKAGLRLIPCKTNKAPTLKAWQTAAKADASTVRGAEMLGVPMGEITCLDIDAKHQAGLIEEFEHACENMALGDLLRALPQQLTVNGGCHYFARVDWLGDPLGNTKLATNADKQTTIETRGKGGFAIVAPSDGYMFVRGSIANVPTITEDEWRQLEAVARSFNIYVKPSKANDSPSGTSSQGISPGDDYDTRGDVCGLLESNGWKFIDDQHVTRPGKKEGISATFGRVGERKFYVFSSNADPFEPEQSYSPFAVYATLLHGGDFNAAARALSFEGYGESSLPEVDAATNAAVEALLSKHNAEADTMAAQPSGQSLFDQLQARKFDAANPVKEIPALVHLGDTPIIRQRNISTLTAHNGMGKTHVLAAIMRAVTHDERALGFTGDIDGAVAYVDFEQSLDDFDAAMRFQAGATSTDNLVPYHLTGLSPKDARAAIRAIMECEPNLRLLIIDGYADCVSSPNAEDECNDFIKELLFTANERNFAILGVLHLNPGQAAKSRGHLGSEVERKSETVLQIDHNSKDDTRELWTRKARKKPIVEGSGIRFQWSDDDKCFVEINGTKKEAKEAEKVAEWRIELDEVIDHTGVRAWRYSDLKNAIMDVTKKGEATAKNRIKDWAKSGVLQHDKANHSYHA